MLGVVTYIFNLGSQEAEAGKSDFQASQSCLVSLPKKKETGNGEFPISMNRKHWVLLPLGWAEEESHFWRQTKNVPMQGRGS